VEIYIKTDVLTCSIDEVRHRVWVGDSRYLKDKIERVEKYATTSFYASTVRLSTEVYQERDAMRENLRKAYDEIALLEDRQRDYWV
jgi:hypothetical protein